MRYSRKLLVQVSEDTNALYKDFYTEDALDPLIADGCTAFASQRFVASSSQVPVSLGFGNVGMTASVYVTVNNPCTLSINGGTSTPGGYNVTLTPTAVGNAAEFLSDDSSITSVVVTAKAGFTVQGRFIVVGAAQVSP